MANSVKCPGCEKTYSVPTEQLGKKATCKSCGQKFVLQTEPDAAAIPPSLPAAAQPVEDEPPPEPEKPKGFFQRMQSKLNEKAKKMQANLEKRKADLEKSKKAAGLIRPEKPQPLYRGEGLLATDPEIPKAELWWKVTFLACSLQTDFGVDPQTDLKGHFSGSCLILRENKRAFVEEMKEVFRIPLLEIETLEVETADRMSMGNIGVGFLLAGPVGALLGGMGKRKEKFLRIDWAGGHSILFGDAVRVGGGVTTDKLKLLITKAIRQVKEAGADESAAAVSATATETSSENSGTDIADAIQKLAALRDQGILTEDEFTTKKAELLSRM